MFLPEGLLRVVASFFSTDRLFPFGSSCPPRTFLPALCKIFLDESAPDNVLEVTARAITYYLDVSAECTRRIVGVDGAIKALCNRLVVVELNNRTSRDLAEQCVKVRTVIVLCSLSSSPSSAEPWPCETRVTSHSFTSSLSPSSAPMQQKMQEFGFISSISSGAAGQYLAQATRTTASVHQYSSYISVHRLKLV